MKIRPVLSPIIFKQQSPLKKNWLKGKMPSVKKGIYGGELTKDNVTLEHILPLSKGGTNDLSNLALAVGKNNWNRGAEPLIKVLKPEDYENYIRQFKNVSLPDIDGKKYVESLNLTVERVIANGD